MSTIVKRIMLAVTAAVTVLASMASAGSVNTNDANVAIEGYDPVAYFTEARPVEGVSDFQTTWQGAIWQFSSSEHKALFNAAPEKYAPRYGGYCAGAMGVRGAKSKIDPQLWKIVDGNLYLGADERFNMFFSEDVDARLERADENWKASN